MTRNSLNDATDDDETTLATWTIPSGTLRIGSMFDVIALFENTSSASVKAFNVRIDGTSVGGGNINTTNQSFGIRWPYHVQDNNTIIFLNNGSIGAGSAAGLLTTKPSLNIVTTPIVVTITVRWTTQPILSEFIRVKHAKLILVP